MRDLIKNNLIFLIVFLGLVLCGTHITTAQVKKVTVPTVQKAKTPGLRRGHQVQKTQESSAGTNEIAEAAIKDKADALAAKYLASGSGGVGLVIGVIDGDRRMILAYGETVKGNGQKPRTNTIFQIGSVTKVFTATLLAIYAEKNVVNYSDPLQKYVPIPVPTKGGRKITLFDLATHYSGLPKTVTATTGPTSVEQAYTILKTTKLLSKPGDTWAYSNLGFGFLALAVADAASNPRWASLIEKDIAKPLNLVDTRAVELNVPPPERAAQGYTTAGNPTESTMPGWPALGGAGELYSTPDDMMKFLSFNMGLTQTPLNSLLPDLHKSWRPVTGQAGRTQGLGWNILETKTRTVWKNGTTPGFQSYIGFCKGKKSGVFVLSNSLQLKATPLGQELLGFLTGDPQLKAGTPDGR
jgi:serine-type D-Ala-D-Ala carboxypeptidase/endopeptidase